VQKTDNLRAWLTMVRAPGLGGRRLIGLVEQFGNPEAVLETAARRPQQLGLEGETTRALAEPDEPALEADLAWAGAENQHFIPWSDERYPALLRRLDSPPAALFVQGDPHALWLPQLAIVGSRNPTSGGLEHARAFSAEIGRLGLAVCSGLAHGIDAAAHGAALEAGAATIAVTGTGLDRVYPASSATLAQRIVLSGALVSEFPPGTPPRRSNFPARNRIIAGLSLGVLVVEAGLNSGSLITARQAAEQGKEVFALPGSLHNPMVKGCHRLIKQGARLVETTNDILEVLAPQAGELAGALREALAEPEKADGASEPAGLLDDPDYRKLWEALSFDPKPIDRLVLDSGLGAREVSSMLLMLELRDMVSHEPGSRFCRKP
jgi:DNA processing protein